MKTEDCVKASYDVMRAGQLASALEVSGWPKPGNVHRTKDEESTRFEHFIAGAVAIGPALREAALKGMDAGEGLIDPQQVGLGYYVKMAIGDVAAIHLGGNTHLGSSLLLIPLAASAGKTFVEKGMMNFRRLRDNVETLMRTTTPKDAVDVYEAIRMAGDTEQLGKWSGSGAPDVYAEGSEDRLTSAGITLYEAMKTASSWDTIASEWANGMKVSFEVGYPTLVEVYARTADINIATVHTYLTILSTVPDTFIARKVGLKEVKDISKAVEVGREKTSWITEVAGNILKVGGLTTPEGREAIEKFDDRLHQAKGLLNPGTSADLTTSSLMIALLCGLRF